MSEPQHLTLYRYYIMIPLAEVKVSEALNKVRTCLANITLTYVMGELYWHDGYWQWNTTGGGLPGAFWVRFDDFFHQDRLEKLFQAVFFGPAAQVRLQRHPDYFHLALLSESPLPQESIPSWMVVPGNSEVDKYPPISVFLTGENDADRLRRFSFAHRSGAFEQAFVEFLPPKTQNEGLSRLQIVEYRQNGNIFDWRLTYADQQA